MLEEGIALAMPDLVGYNSNGTIIFNEELLNSCFQERMDSISCDESEKRIDITYKTIVDENGNLLYHYHKGLFSLWYKPLAPSEIRDAQYREGLGALLRIKCSLTLCNPVPIYAVWNG